MKKSRLANRDLSWLSFNKQVLLEALAEEVPLRERINFLAIFSSNLDEFYRVRYPVVQFLARTTGEPHEEISSVEVKARVDREIAAQQILLGGILRKIMKELKKEGIEWIYSKKIPHFLQRDTATFFRDQVMGRLQIIDLKYSLKTELFAPNSKIFLVFSHPDHDREPVFIPLPTPVVSRFLTFSKRGKKYVVFLEDLIREELIKYRPDLENCQTFTFKVNRNAEMNLKEEVSSKLSKQIKTEIRRREFGIPTRMLCQNGMPKSLVDKIQHSFDLDSVNRVEGGAYHQLQDLFGFPLDQVPSGQWTVTEPKLGQHLYLLDEILQRDLLIHPPYQAFSPILRLFNEAAIHPDVKEIYLTIYRVAKDSKILQALISAAQNGKKVTVFVELKARFDEENNLAWSEKMKAAGIRIKYSIPKLKVHAKAALLKLKKPEGIQKIALLGTGNFNESTAKVYTDHFLITANPIVCNELNDFFKVLTSNPDRKRKEDPKFSILWVGKYNLKEQILERINGEIQSAQAGKRSEIFLKMNNLEEPEVIKALYQASQSGVKIRLLIRGICRLVPGLAGLSESISVKRIVDHYLEHGRIFHFHSNGQNLIYLGSADWMDRNLNRRIEVCFPLLDEKLKSQVSTLLEIQWNDNQKSQVFPPSPQSGLDKPFRSQVAITSFLSKDTK